MNFFINSTRKNTGKDQSQSKSSHRAAVGGMNHILVGLPPCGKFNGPWGFRQVKQWTGKSHAKSSAWWSNIQNNRTEVLKAISGQGLAGRRDSKSWTRLATRSWARLAHSADRAIPPGGSGLRSEAGGPLRQWQPQDMMPRPMPTKSSQNDAHPEIGPRV